MTTFAHLTTAEIANLIKNAPLNRDEEIKELRNELNRRLRDEILTSLYDKDTK